MFGEWCSVKSSVCGVQYKNIGKFFKIKTTAHDILIKKKTFEVKVFFPFHKVP